MKKSILTMFLAIGTLFSQAQIYPCDSIGYTYTGGSLTLELTGTLTSTFTSAPTFPFPSAFNGAVTSWDWTVTSDVQTHIDTGQTATINLLAGTYLVNVCLATNLELSPQFGSAPMTCLNCDSLIYGNNGWSLFSTPTGTKEIQISKMNDGKMYDLLGREIIEPEIGVMYIRNQKKYIRER